MNIYNIEELKQTSELNIRIRHLKNYIANRNSHDSTVACVLVFEYAHAWLAHRIFIHWCGENCSGSFDFVQGGYMEDSAILFANEIDAIQCKLTWG